MAFSRIPCDGTDLQVPADEPLKIVYLDDWLLVANKPAGLLAVPGRGQGKQDSLASRIQKSYPDALIVHRLDMATSGLMMFARGTLMQRRLSAMFSERNVAKLYQAIVTGIVRPAFGEVDLPILADWPNRPLRTIDCGSGKPSLTRFRVLTRDRTTNSSRVELEPVTGRTHQLRVHMTAIGHPIQGDSFYGPKSGSRSGRLLLHASRLRCIHPFSGASLDFISEPLF